MKKTNRCIFAFLLLIITAFVFSACSFTNAILSLIEGEDGIGTIRDKAEIERLDNSEKIISYFKTEDVEGLKELLCEKSKKLPNIDEQIQKGFDFIVGEITDYSVASENIGEEAGKNHGVIDLFAYYSRIYNIKTNQNKSYEISFHSYYVVRNSDRKGITNIVIDDNNNTSDIYDDDTYLRIGYRWKERYGFESFDYTSGIVKSLEDKDETKLLSILSTTAKSEANISKQIQDAISFFDSKPIWGEVVDKNGNEYYDGNHDLRTDSVIDEVEIDIESEQETLIYLVVKVSNIECTNGKIFSLVWSGYVLNKDNPGLVGVDYFEIINNSESYVVGNSEKYLSFQN